MYIHMYVCVENGRQEDVVAHFSTKSIMKFLYIFYNSSVAQRLGAQQEKWAEKQDWLWQFFAGNAALLVSLQQVSYF